MPTVEWTDPELVRDTLRVLARPGIGDELRALGVADGSGQGSPCVLVSSEQAQYVRRRIAEELGRVEARTVSGRGRKPRGTLIPRALVEEALKRARDDLGRRKIAEAIPGLTEHQARVILKWREVPEPAGLWLDEHDRVKWGPGISPTDGGLRLPPL